MVAAELQNAFGVTALSLLVSGGARLSAEGQAQIARSYFTFKLVDATSEPEGDPGNAKFPLKRIYQAMPDLKTKYRAQQKKGHTRTFESRQNWTPGNMARAEKFHEDMALRFFNFGGQIVGGVVLGGPPPARWSWRLEPNSGLLPCLTSGLLLSFVLASLSRYRADVLGRVENSKINLLFEIFTNESDGFIIPAMRNLLYAETMYVRLSEFT
jgi:hypothetical protein